MKKIMTVMLISLATCVALMPLFDDIIPAVLTYILLVGVIGTPILAHRKHRDVGRWLCAALVGHWVSAGVSFLGILMFADIQKLPEDERGMSAKREKQFCWSVIIGAAMLWLVLITILM